MYDIDSLSDKFLAYFRDWIRGQNEIGHKE